MKSWSLTVRGALETENVSPTATFKSFRTFECTIPFKSVAERNDEAITEALETLQIDIRDYDHDGCFLCIEERSTLGMLEMIHISVNEKLVDAGDAHQDEVALDDVFISLVEDEESGDREE